MIPLHRRPEFWIPAGFTTALLGWAYWVVTSPLPPIPDTFLYFLWNQK